MPGLGTAKEGKMEHDTLEGGPFHKPPSAKKRGCLHYLDHYEVDEASYGDYIQDGSTGSGVHRLLC